MGDILLPGTWAELSRAVPWSPEADKRSLPMVIQREDSLTVTSSTLARMDGKLGSPGAVTHVASVTWPTQESQTPRPAAQGPECLFQPRGFFMTQPQNSHSITPPHSIGQESQTCPDSRDGDVDPTCPCEVCQKKKKKKH